MLLLLSYKFILIIIINFIIVTFIIM